jgi:hypothetical protein
MTDNRPERAAWLMRDEATMAAIQGLRRQGITTAADIARALNERGIATPKGDRWYAMQVQRIIAMGTTRAPNLPRR